jgi:hypothetical protein
LRPETASRSGETGDKRLGLVAIAIFSSIGESHAPSV